MRAEAAAAAALPAPMAKILDEDTVNTIVAPHLRLRDVPRPANVAMYRLGAVIVTVLVTVVSPDEWESQRPAHAELIAGIGDDGAYLIPGVLTFRVGTFQVSVLCRGIASPREPLLAIARILEPRLRAT